MTSSYVSRADPRATAADAHAYRPEIDGLRALAVIAVITNHFEKSALASGHLGVDVFFVISGFVISSSLYKRGDPTFKRLLTSFYVRRVKRLLPALVACVLVTCFAICLFDRNPGTSLRTGIAALLGLANQYLLHQATDYFGLSAQLNVFTHMWSLGVEEQFYVFFPIIVWLTRMTRSGELKSFSIVIACLSVASLALFVYLSRVNEAAAFYLMPARFWELGAGCLAFAWTQKRNPADSGASRKFNSFMLLCVICAVFAAPVTFSVVLTAMAVLLTAALIISIRPGTLGSRVLSHSIVVYIGQISYSLYLWHWSVIGISHWTIGIHWWSVPLQAVSIFGLAAISYRFLERPLRRAEWASTGPRTILIGVAASLGAAMSVGLLGKFLKEQLYTGSPPQMIAKGVGTLRDPYTAPDGRSAWLGEACVLADNNEVGKTISEKDCTLGDFRNAKRRVLIVGNSYAAAFVRGFDQLVTEDDFAVTITSSWGASPVPNMRNDTQWNKANDWYWAKIVPALIEMLSPGDAVFLISDLAEFSPREPTGQSDQRLVELGQGIEQLSASLGRRGIELVVLDGNPFARDANCDPDVAARQWFAPFGGPCRYYSRAESLARRGPLDVMLSSLRDQGKIELLDLFDVFCPTATCTYEAVSGQMLYRDPYSHPSVEAVQLAAPIIRSALLRSPRNAAVGNGENDAR